MFILIFKQSKCKSIMGQFSREPRYAAIIDFTPLKISKMCHWLLCRRSCEYKKDFHCSFRLYVYRNSHAFVSRSVLEFYKEHRHTNRKHINRICEDKDTHTHTQTKVYVRVIFPHNFW